MERPGELAGAPGTGRRGRPDLPGCGHEGRAQRHQRAVGPFADHPLRGLRALRSSALVNRGVIRGPGLGDLDGPPRHEPGHPGKRGRSHLGPARGRAPDRRCTLGGLGDPRVGRRLPRPGGGHGEHVPGDDHGGFGDPGAGEGGVRRRDPGRPGDRCRGLGPLDGVRSDRGFRPRLGPGRILDLAAGRYREHRLAVLGRGHDHRREPDGRRAGHGRSSARWLIDPLGQHQRRDDAGRRLRPGRVDRADRPWRCHARGNGGRLVRSAGRRHDHAGQESERLAGDGHLRGFARGSQRARRGLYPQDHLRFRSRSRRGPDRSCAVDDHGGRSPHLFDLRPERDLHRHRVGRYGHPQRDRPLHGRREAARGRHSGWPGRLVDHDLEPHGRIARHHRPVPEHRCDPRRQRRHVCRLQRRQGGADDYHQQSLEDLRDNPEHERLHRDHHGPGPR